MPFTMEGTMVEPPGTNNGFCVASLVLGILSIPTFFMVIVPILAIVFGIIGWRQAAVRDAAGSSKGLAIAGMILGTIGLLIAIKAYHIV